MTHPRTTTRPHCRKDNTARQRRLDARSLDRVTGGGGGGYYPASMDPLPGRNALAKRGSY